MPHGCLLTRPIALVLLLRVLVPALDATGTTGLPPALALLAWLVAAGPGPNRAFVTSATQLNALGACLPDVEGVHALTDVTGFGLLGHALELCRGSDLGASILLSDVPLLPDVDLLARDGVGTGAASRNWASYGTRVRLPDGFPDWQRGLLCDPQTSGGLLIATAPDAVAAVLRLAKDAGFQLAGPIGSMMAGEPMITVISSPIGMP